MSKTTSSQTTSGQIINLLANDASRFDLAFMFFHNLWIGPLQAIIITYILWDLFGPSALIGLTVLLMFIPFNGNACLVQPIYCIIISSTLFTKAKT